MEWVIIVFAGALFVSSITAVLILGGQAHKDQIRKILEEDRKRRNPPPKRPAFDKEPRIPWPR